MKAISQDLPKSTPANRAAVAESARSLLAHLIDYAGLFPPASLGMAAAVPNYDVYLRSEQNWMLGRFIVPVVRLGEFEEAIGRLTQDQTESRWCLSALPGANLLADLAAIREFNDRFAAFDFARKISIESIEVKIASAEEIERLSKLIPSKLETYFEIPWASSGGMRDCITAVAGCQRRPAVRWSTSIPPTGAPARRQ